MNYNDLISKKRKSRISILLVLVVLVGLACSRTETSSENPPNVIIIFTDDMGYADLGKYGAEGYETPNLDQMADDGMRFTSFYSAASYCTPSRAALLTGRYPQRVGLPNNLFPWYKIGLNTDELTIAELLKKQGYATKAIGKWHLGAHPELLPTNHGFDEYFGFPYSNDMSPKPENNPRPDRRVLHPPLPLIEDTTILEREPDQAELLHRYTKRAVEFIDANQEQPFFLYFPHHFPHVPLFATELFQGTTERGIYGDVVREIDWSVGQILQALEERNLRENTLVFFLSDNGPWLVFGDHGGSAGNFREGKGTSFEGGQRVPAIASWPGHIPSGTVTDKVATTMDLMPTIARLAGADHTGDRIIDGHDIWPILSGEAGAESPYLDNPFYFYRGSNLQAVRLGPWKLHVPHEYHTVVEPGSGGDVGESETREIGLSLYNLEKDPGETSNLADEHPQKVKELMGWIEEGRKELGDTDIEGSHTGEPGRIDEVWEKIYPDE